MINYITGDILTSNDPYILQQVNNRGVMGAGLALQIREHITLDDYYKYKKSIGNASCMGKVIKIKNKDKENQTFLNLVGQDNYGWDGEWTDYNAFKIGLEYIAANIKEGTAISIPYKIGCGLAGGNWDRIFPMIKEILGDKFIVNIYKLK